MALPDYPKIYHCRVTELQLIWLRSRKGAEVVRKLVDERIAAEAKVAPLPASVLPTIARATKGQLSRRKVARKAKSRKLSAKRST